MAHNAVAITNGGDGLIPTPRRWGIFTPQAIVGPVHQRGDFLFELGGVMPGRKPGVELDGVFERIFAVGEIHPASFQVGNKGAMQGRLLHDFLNEKVLRFARIHGHDLRHSTTAGGESRGFARLALR
jgi:hypothetical protein